MFCVRSRNFWKAISLSFMAMVISACAAYKPLDPAFHKALTEPYRLDSGDTLRVTVFGQDELTNTYTVDKAGHISFPLVGSVGARGVTPRPFFILGEVGTSGQYVYVPGMTVQNAIAIAGGFSARADQSNVDITRNINGDIVTGRVPISDPILPGDTIAIRERLF